jgi:crotonobetainyl-CoA:carnitine CoA-transferase CaiB-like acyl-CoA transferase
VRQPLQFRRRCAGPALGVPRLGEHTRCVLAEAGYTLARIDALLETGAAEEG